MCARPPCSSRSSREIPDILREMHFANRHAQTFIRRLTQRRWHLPSPSQPAPPERNSKIRTGRRGTTTHARGMFMLNALMRRNYVPPLAPGDRWCTVTVGIRLVYGWWTDDGPPTVYQRSPSTICHHIPPVYRWSTSRLPMV